MSCDTLFFLPAPVSWLDSHLKGIMRLLPHFYNILIAFVCCKKV